MSQLTHLARQLRPTDWVQLFGTVLSALLAIVGSITGAVIGVNLGNKNARKVQEDEANHQLERDRQIEAVRLNALLEALREELSVSWNAYVLVVGQWVEDVSDSEALLPFWPCYGDYFVIFKSNAGNLGMIKNGRLRKVLVEVYVCAQSHIDTYQAFNRIRDDWERSGRQVWAQALAPLKDYRPRVLRSHTVLKDLVKESCTLLDAELGTSITQLFLINKTVPPEAANVASHN